MSLKARADIYFVVVATSYTELGREQLELGILHDPGTPGSDARWRHRL